MDRVPLPPHLEEMRQGLLGYSEEVKAELISPSFRDVGQKAVRRMEDLDRHLDAALTALDEVGEEIQSVLQADRRRARAKEG